MAAIFAIVFLLAAVTRPTFAGSLIQDWERDVCAAYFKVSGLDRSTFPVGQIWQDKVCVSDPSFYLVCEYFNGVFSGEKRQCPSGKLFYHGKNKFWEKTCVPANQCDSNKQCPNWLQIAQPTPVLKECLRRWNEAQRAFEAGVNYYLPRCDVNGDYKPLQCSNAGCWCVSPTGTMVSEVQLAGLTEETCLLYRKDPFNGKPGLGFKLGLKRDRSPVIATKVIVNPVISTAGLTQRQCACKTALKFSTSGSSSAYACDPYLPINYLICQDDGTFESKTCPDGKAWNYVEKTCSDKMRKCRPLLATCSTM